MKFVIVLSFSFHHKWLQFSRAERSAFEARHILPILGKYMDRLKIRMCDAEAFTASCSDFLIIEATDIKDYYFLIEEIRDSALITEGFAEFKDILIGIEDGFKEFERANPESEAK